VITTGVLGHDWRACVTPWGAIEPWPGSGERLDWWVAADDRWHVPADEATVRQVRVEGTAVTETRVRVPRGDVVQHVYTVADAGGITVVEVTNESTLPVAIAFGRRDVLTERPIVDVPIEGIDLPAGAFALPLGHQASFRIGIPHVGTGTNAPLPAALPPVAQVARGWLTITDRASRFALPDGELAATLAAAVTAERCELALGAIPSAAGDAAGYAVALGELVRMGESPDPWLPELVDAVEQLGARESWESDVALAAAGRVLALADESRASRDLQRIVARRAGSARPARPPAGPLSIAWLEAGLALGGALLPEGFPGDWLGQSIEVYGVPTGPRSAVSYAVRWHGPRPAVLWEQTGEPVELTAPTVAPAWRTPELTGEALWPEPSTG
jgi:hypothetical protein